MTYKEQYRLFCLEEKRIPIFSQSWWLDAVCGENWDVVLVNKGGKVIASFPFLYKKEKTYFSIGMPPLTQKMGCYIKYPENQGGAKKLSFEKEICDEILSKLPKYDIFDVNFNYDFTNWLPFYWKGFKQMTKYTYLIDNLSDDVFSHFAPQKRTDVRKALKSVDIKYDLSPEDFIDFYIKSLSKQGKKLNYSRDFFLNLCKIVMNNNSGRIIYAVLKNDPLVIVGAIFYVIDQISIYSLVTAFDPEYRQLAASTYLFYQIMDDYKHSGLMFDFEGSMVFDIEKSYNKFGTKQVPYFRIYNKASRKAIIRESLKRIYNTFR